MGSLPAVGFVAVFWKGEVGIRSNLGNSLEAVV
jgi:hypothetical protein